MGLADAYEHGIARGIVRYAKDARGWDLYGYGWMFRPLDALEVWRGDGIVARVESREDAAGLAALKVPIVDVAGAYRRPSFHLVANDDEATGRKAGLYLRSCGFQRFAFCGVAGTGWSTGRGKGFAEAVRPFCPEVPVFEEPLAWWESLEESGRLRSWISHLERPVGVFACNDTSGLKLAEVCRSLSVPVPDSVAILGVDNEDILCEMASPSLSSIELDCETIGYRAAALLDRLTAGSRPAGSRSARSAGAREQRRVILVAPKDIVERESTQVFSCGDPIVEQAVRSIRLRAAQGATAGAILAELAASRRSAEIRFRRATGRSIREEILRVRIARAKALLRSTGLTIAAVAAESGFASAQRFHEAFRMLEGVPPGVFRNRA
jgi:LacI family transcriptional regulator